MQDNGEVRVRYGWSNDVLEVFLHRGGTYRITASTDEPGRLKVERREPVGWWSTRWVFVEHCDSVDEAIQRAVERKNAKLEEDSDLREEARKREEAYEAAKAKYPTTCPTNDDAQRTHRRGTDRTAHRHFHPLAGGRS